MITIFFFNLMFWRRLDNWFIICLTFIPLFFSAWFSLSRSFFFCIKRYLFIFRVINLICFLIIFMFIGGASGSTAGGIKTSTFALVFVNALATIRGRKRVEMFHYTIPVELLNLAMSAFLFSGSSILLGIFFLTITDGHLGLARLAFEEVSAFCTVGLSTGITRELSTTGQSILMASMLIGRVGTVTLAFALTSRKKESHDYTYPKSNVQVG